MGLHIEKMLGDKIDLFLEYGRHVARRRRRRRRGHASHDDHECMYASPISIHV